MGALEEKMIKDYYIDMGFIDSSYGVIQNYSDIDHYDSFEEAKEAFDKLDKDFVYKHLMADLGSYGSDKYFYKRLHATKEGGCWFYKDVILFAESWPMEEKNGMSNVQ